MSKKFDFEIVSVHEGPKESPGFLLWRVSTSWRTHIESVLKKLNLTHPQFVVLATTGWLTRKGGFVTQTAIGTMAGLDPNTNSQIIKGLELKKLIKRTPSTDGRAKNVSLTGQGIKVLGLALPAVEKTDAEFFCRLTEKELNSLLKVFGKLLL
jgi:DNA-binding MarR family transcriptional regulator